LSRENSFSLSRSVVTAVGGALRPLQFRGKWKVTELLSGLLHPLAPEADCHPVPGARLRISLGDRIGRLMWTGCYETELVAFLQSMLEPGMVFVDVGANVGYFSVTAAALVGHTGRVHSFEADPGCFSRLAGNARDYPWFTPYHTAVADYVGDIDFYRSSGRGESGWGNVFGAPAAHDRVSVSVCTLDGWSKQQAVHKVDFLKMDVEGAEYRVLRGGRSLLNATRPVMWVEADEVCLQRDGKSVADLLGLLAEWDYSVLGLYEPRRGALTNIIAVPNEQSRRLEKIKRLNPVLQPVAVESLVAVS
jgi:FkbM family methyltransferase